MSLRPMLIAAALPLAGCIAEADRSADVRAPAVEVVGEPENCIQTSRIRSTRVRDDYTIDFEMTGGQVYRNTLPLRCPGLGFEQRFSHSATTGSLCGVDTITVLYTDRGQGATCGLGRFVPVRYVDAD